MSRNEQNQTFFVIQVQASTISQGQTELPDRHRPNNEPCRGILKIRHVPQKFILVLFQMVVSNFLKAAALYKHHRVGRTTEFENSRNGMAEVIDSVCPLGP